MYKGQDSVQSGSIMCANAALRKSTLVDLVSSFSVLFQTDYHSTRHSSEHSVSSSQYISLGNAVSETPLATGVRKVQSFVNIFRDLQDQKALPPQCARI